MTLPQRVGMNQLDVTVANHVVPTIVLCLLHCCCLAISDVSKRLQCIEPLLVCFLAWHFFGQCAPSKPTQDELLPTLEKVRLIGVATSVCRRRDQARHKLCVDGLNVSVFLAPKHEGFRGTINS